MVDLFQSLSPVMQAFVAGVFTWFITAVGAAAVFFIRRVNQKWLDGMLGFAAGVMLAASYWSLLAPAIEIAEVGILPAWLVPAAGFIIGAAVIGADDLPTRCPYLLTPETCCPEVLRKKP